MQYRTGDTVFINDELYVAEEVYKSDYTTIVHFRYAGTRFATNYRKVLEFDAKGTLVTTGVEIRKCRPEVKSGSTSPKESTIKQEEPKKQKPVKTVKTYADLLRG